MEKHNLRFLCEKNLSDLCLNESASVKHIKSGTDMCKRFWDMGIIEGTPVKCVLCGSCGLKAFLIRGAVYALRKEDAENIIIE